MDDQNLKKKSKKRKNLNHFEVEEVNEPLKKKKKSKSITELDKEENEIGIEEKIEINHENHPEVVIKEADTWTPEDYSELIRRMEVQLPANDTQSFTSRVEKLDWDQIQFGGHSVDECYEKWKVIRGKVRHYRLLGEVLEDAKVWAKKPWAVTHGKKKNRHPEQPTRPLSSFMLFYMEKKNKIIKRNPELKMTEISRIIGEKFKALSDEKKAYYVEQAKSTQMEYKQNLLKFYKKYPEFLRANKKQTNKTNKPLPPIKLYLNDKLNKHQNDENFNQQEYTEKYKELWKSLSNKKKAYWIRQAKEEEDKHLEQLHEDVLHDGENRPSPSFKSVITKEEQSILDRLAGKPEKPPNSAYSLFSRLMLKDKDKNYVEGEPKNRMREVANMWKEVPEEQKKAYAEKVQHMHETYKLEFASYLESLPEEKRAEELAKLQPKKKTARVRQKAVKKNSDSSKLKTKDIFKNEPEKPPVTAWDLYKSEFFKKNSHLPDKIAHKQAAEMWKMLSKKETERYRKKHEQLKEKYMVDFEAFLQTLDEDELKEYSSLKTGVDDLLEIMSDESSSEEQGNNSSSSSSSSSEDGDSGVNEEEF